MVPFHCVDPAVIALAFGKFQMTVDWLAPTSLMVASGARLTVPESVTLMTTVEPAGALMSRVEPAEGASWEMVVSKALPLVEVPVRE